MALIESARILERLSHICDRFDYEDDATYWKRFLNTGGLLENVPRQFFTEELFITAIDHYDPILPFYTQFDVIPANLLTHDICMHALRKYWSSFYSIPMYLKTMERFLERPRSSRALSSSLTRKPLLTFRSHKSVSGEERGDEGYNNLRINFRLSIT